MARPSGLYRQRFLAVTAATTTVVLAGCSRGGTDGGAGSDADTSMNGDDTGTRSTSEDDSMADGQTMTDTETMGGNDSMPETGSMDGNETMSGDDSMDGNETMTGDGSMNETDTERTALVRALP